MKKQTCKKFNSLFKAKVAREATKGQQTLAELSKKFGLNQVVISRCKAEFLANAGSGFDKAGKSAEPEVDAHELYAQI
jgi:transposase-like protein